jgi:hypothetical protein
MGSWWLSWSHNVESLRHFRACGSYQDFLDGMLLLLTRKLQNRRFLVVLFKSSIRKIYGRHHDLVNRYGVSVTNDDGNISFVVTEYLSQMTTGIFRLLLRSICHNWRREYFACRGHNPVISSFITHHRIFHNKSNTTGDTGWEGTAYLPGAPEFNPKILVRFFLCNLQFSV